MVELESKVTESGVLYVPKEIREAFGRRMRIIPDACAAVFFAAGTPYEDVADSLKVILADIEYRAKREKRSAGKVGQC
jgi:hypothetical protein